MTIAEKFRDAMTLQWESGYIRQFDHAIKVLKCFSDKLTRVPMLPSKDWDRNASKWIFDDDSWAIVADDGSAVYEVGPVTEATTAELKTCLRDIILVFDDYQTHEVPMGHFRKVIDAAKRLIR